MKNTEDQTENEDWWLDVFAESVNDCDTTKGSMKPDAYESEDLLRMREWELPGKPGGPASQVVTAVATYTELGGAATRVDRVDGVRRVVPEVLQPSGDESSPRTSGPVQQDATNRGGPRHHGPPPGLGKLGGACFPSASDEKPVRKSPVGGATRNKDVRSGPEHEYGRGGLMGPVSNPRDVQHEVKHLPPGGGARVEQQYGGDHYQRLHPEPIDVIESWGLGFNLGNVIKYVARAGHKHSSTATEDLTKARWYINRALAGLQH